MSDRLDWTVAPTLAWGAALLCAALLVLDGNLGALTARLVRDEVDAVRVAGGPSFLPPEGPPQDSDSEASEGSSESTPMAGLADPGAAAPAAPRAKHGVEDVCIEPAGTGCRRWAMDGYYAAVAGTETGRATAPVRVTWYGDSVSATDLIPGRVRA